MFPIFKDFPIFVVRFLMILDDSDDFFDNVLLFLIFVSPSGGGQPQNPCTHLPMKKYLLSKNDWYCLEVQVVGAWWQIF